MAWQNVLSVLQFGKFPLFLPHFWLIHSKSNGIFQNFIIFLIKSTVGPALCIELCLMYGQMGKFMYIAIVTQSLFESGHLVSVDSCLLLSVV